MVPLSGTEKDRCAMAKNIVSQISVHQEHELLAKLEAAGLTGPLAQKVIESRDNALAKEVVSLIRGPGPDFPNYSVWSTMTRRSSNWFGAVGTTGPTTASPVATFPRPNAAMPNSRSSC